MKENLREIYEIYKARSKFEVQDILNKQYEKIEELHPFIRDLLLKKIRPYSSHMTLFIEDSKIQNTSNWIERIFEDIAPKHLKNKYRTTEGFISRLKIKLLRWNMRNACF